MGDHWKNLDMAIKSGKQDLIACESYRLNCVFADRPVLAGEVRLGEIYYNSFSKYFYRNSFQIHKRLGIAILTNRIRTEWKSKDWLPFKDTYPLGVGDCEWIQCCNRCQYCGHGLGKYEVSGGHLERFWNYQIIKGQFRVLEHPVIVISDRNAIGEMMKIPSRNRAFTYGYCGCDISYYWESVARCSKEFGIYQMASQLSRIEFLNQSKPVKKVKRSELEFFQMANAASQISKKLK